MIIQRTYYGYEETDDEDWEWYSEESDSEDSLQDQDGN